MGKLLEEQVKQFKDKQEQDKQAEIARQQEELKKQLEAGEFNIEFKKIYNEVILPYIKDDLKPTLETIGLHLTIEPEIHLSEHYSHLDDTKNIVIHKHQDFSEKKKYVIIEFSAEFNKKGVQINFGEGKSHVFNTGTTILQDEVNSDSIEKFITGNFNFLKDLLK